MSDYLEDPYFTTEPGFEFLADWRSGWQFGEQGLVECIVHVLPSMSDIEGVAVEIGGGDGIKLPLTCQSLLANDWHVIAYEGDEDAWESLAKHLSIYPHHPSKARGRYEGGPIPQCDVLIIDIDGRDSVAMKHALRWCNPSLVVVEHYDIAGPYMSGVEHSMAQPIPEWMLGMSIDVPGASHFIIQDRYQYLDTIAAGHGLIPICRTRVNSFYMPPNLAQELYCNV